MGSMIKVVSALRTSPAPLDIHTENVKRFRGASFLLVCCFHLMNISLHVGKRKNNCDTPSYDEQCNVESMEQQVEAQLSGSHH